jgi:general secretion pathway protein F
MLLFLLLTGLRPALPSVIDRVSARIPIYKDLAMAKRSYISLYGLSVLLNAGLRIEEAFRLAAESTGRGELKDDYVRARNAVLTGQSWPNAMHSLHPTDRASLITAQNREQIARTIKELSHQYKSLYQQRVESVIPGMQLLSALYLSLAGVVMFGVVVLPLLQVTQGIMGKI